MQKSLLPHANNAGYNSNNVTFTEFNYLRWLHQLLIQNSQQVYLFIPFPNLCFNKTFQITSAGRELYTEVHLHGLIIFKYYFPMCLIVMLRSLTLTTKIQSAVTPRSPRAEWTMISWGTSKPFSNFPSTAQANWGALEHPFLQLHCSQQSSFSRGSNQKLDLLSTFRGFLLFSWVFFNCADTAVF